MHPHTRKHDRLYENARLYVLAGFTHIPIDEVINYTADDIKKIENRMTELRNYENTIIKLTHRPWGTGTRESIIGPSVGADYRELRDKFLARNDLIAQAHGASGGRKSKKRKSKKRKSKKRKSRK
jgi:hypothetical protein